jgi:transcriptional regulator with XRE-family HTH domain
VSLSDREMREAIRSLRATLSESRPQFAKRLGISARTLARYELENPLKHSVPFKRLASIAEEAGRKDLWTVFTDAEKQFVPIQRSWLGHSIRTFRAALGLTQEEFAREAGLSLASIAKFEVDTEPKAMARRKLAALARKSNLIFFANLFEGSANLLFAVASSGPYSLLTSIDAAAKQAAAREEWLNLYLALVLLRTPAFFLSDLRDRFSEQLTAIDQELKQTIAMGYGLDAEQHASAIQELFHEAFPTGPNSLSSKADSGETKRDREPLQPTLQTARQ